MEQSFMKELTSFKKSTIHPFWMLGAGTCMLTTLLLGYFLHVPAISSFGSLGIFTFLYYQPLPRKQLVKRLVFIGLFLWLGNILGMLSTYLAWTAPLVVAGIGTCGRGLFRLYHIAKPGAFFVVMVTAMGTGIKAPLTQLPLNSLYLLLGVLLAIATALLMTFSEKELPAPEPRLSLKERLASDPAVILDSLFYGSILFLAVYLSQAFQLTNPYWMVVSCAAILQGDNLRAMMQRNIQRIFGTTIGLGIAAVLLNVQLSQLQIIFIITVFYVLVEYFVRRNYAVASMFTTPMALLLATMIRQQYVYSLIQYRFLGIVLGSLLGLLAAWVMTTGLRFYNRAFDLHETLEKETE